MTKDKALRMALEALEEISTLYMSLPKKGCMALAAIEEVLAQPEQEPVAAMWQHGETGRTRITTPDSITDCSANWFKVSDLYTSPPPRKPLTRERVREICEGSGYDKATMQERADFINGIRHAEAAHSIKENT